MVERREDRSWEESGVVRSWSWLVGGGVLPAGAAAGEGEADAEEAEKSTATCEREEDEVL